jgi:putative transposase
MAAAISPGAGRAYGVARVCDGFGIARSSFYAWRRQQERTDPLPPPTRRGPKPAMSDAAVLSAIRADLARSPWIGEGHRKVWARLRVLDRIRVARKRVLRLMRENGLLSPHRHLPRSDAAHDGRITTDAPNLMWGTDATQIPTVLDGKVWLFAVVEHWNAEGVGWHVAKIGDRYAAAQAVGMAIKTVFGAVAAGIARGVALRHDHGSAFMADHFQNQIKFWGMAPSFAFVAEHRNQRCGRTRHADGLGSGVAVTNLGNVPSEPFGIPVLDDGEQPDFAIQHGRDLRRVGAPHIRFGASVVMRPSWAASERGRWRCGDSRPFSRISRRIRLRATRRPSSTRSRAHTLR